MHLEKKTVRSIFLGVAGCIILYWVLHEPERLTAVLRKGYAVLSPFVAGAAMAFILNVPMRAIERWMKKVKKPGTRRSLAILGTLLAVVLVLTGVVWLLVPQIVKTGEALIEKLPGFFDRVWVNASEFIYGHPELREWLTEYTDFDSINWSEMVQKVITVLSNSVSTIADHAFGAVISLSAGVVNFVLSLVFCIYCLSRKEILARQGRRIAYSILPEKWADEVIRVFRMTCATFTKFISGQCLEAVILAAMFAVCMTVFRMPFMPLVSVVIGVTALIPIVGAFVGCIVGAFFILVQDPMLAVWFVVMFLILQQIEGNMIYPRVVGTSIGLPGMWVLVAVAVGGDLMGVGGMLVMIPLASVLYALARDFTSRRLERKNIDKNKLKDHPIEIKSKFKEKRKQKKEQRLVKKLEKMAAQITHEHEKEGGEQ